MAYFYRRSSGRFYARIRVPEALQSHFRTQELRRSLTTTDRALACHLALAAALQWKAEFARLSGDMDLVKLSAGNPLLLSGGLIKLVDAAAEMGLSVPELFDQFKAGKLALSFQPNGLIGAEVPRLVFDGDGAVGPVVDIGETLDGQRLAPVYGALRLRHEAIALTDGELFSDCAFYSAKGKSVAFDLPGVAVPIGELLALRADCEGVRQKLAGTITPAMLETARPAPAHGADVIEAMQDAVLRKHTSTGARRAAPCWTPITRPRVVVGLQPPLGRTGVCTGYSSS